MDPLLQQTNKDISCITINFDKHSCYASLTNILCVHAKNISVALWQNLYGTDALYNIIPLNFNDINMQN